MMSGPIDWDYLLEKYGIDDALKAQAYEAHKAEERACLKNAIAYHVYLLEQTGCESGKNEYYSKHKHKGYWQSLQTEPVPFVLVVCSGSYISSARFIAACMPAFLQSVPHVAMLSLGTLPCSALLLAMELMGLEESLAFFTDNKNTDKEGLKATELFRHALNAMAEHGPKHMGRVLFLHKGEEEILECINMCRDLHIPYWQEWQAPHIQICTTLPEENLQLLNFAMPDAQLGASSAPLEAWYGASEPQVPCAQQWAEGMEGCFWHKNLNKDFFQQRILKGGALLSEE